MLLHRFRLKSLRLAVTSSALLGLVSLWLTLPQRVMQTVSAQTSSNTFRNFESPQVHPLAITPDGTRLLAVNSPNATLSVFQLASGSPVLTAEIPVGMEPVSVAARSNREAWVVNWLSDSVSIVDLTTGNVTRTIDVGDEPTDVLFAAGGAKAFVCVSGGASISTSNPNPAVLGRGQVKVFDAANPTAAPQVLNIFGKQPRALARDATGGRVFVSVFESGNQTTIVPEPTVSSNGGLPPPSPAMLPGLPPAPRTSLIVRWNGSDWVDELNRSWNSFLPYRLADIDLVEINASLSSPTITANVRGVGTHNGNMTFDPVSNRLAVVNLESANAVRFEPNLKGRFQASRVSFLSAQPGVAPSVASVADLNPHVNPNGPGSDSERAQGLALPSDIARATDGTFYVAATSSGRVGVLDGGGGVQARVNVGAGPTGLALDEARGRLYVLNRFDQTLSIVDTGSRSEVSRLALGNNPEPADVSAGRKLLHSADLSQHGTVSCASCHLNGHRDGLAWDLGNPEGAVDHVTTTAGPSVLHPMKGPMTTQTLRGISENTPFHWRGDRATLAHFNAAFTSLLGGPRLLTPQEMADFTAFIRSLAFPPNPNVTFGSMERNPMTFRIGFSFFNNDLLFAGNPDGTNRQNCSVCHVAKGFTLDTDNRIIPLASLKETQDFKTPQMRGLYQKMGMNRTGSTAGGELSGFGFAHDGAFDTLVNFQLAPMFDFRSAGSDATAASWRQDITMMLLTLDTGTALPVGMMTTVNGANRTSFEVTSRLNALTTRANAGDCEVVARGIFGGRPRAFLRLPNGTYQPDTLLEPPVTQQALLDATGPGAEMTFMGVPPGEGRLFALDRDGDGLLNDDEPRTSVQIAGRVVGADGVGVAGVAVSLSGSQTAAAVTDAAGRYVFNFVSTAGTHTVTPQGAAFTPASATFANPKWDASANFVTLTTANASDSSSFFVTQHYRDFLNRDPDAPGLAFWVGEIEGCGANAQCREVKRINVSGAFFQAIEFQETGFLAYLTRKVSFGDQPGRPIPINFPELMTDAQRLGRNVIVGPSTDWQTQLNANKVAFFTGWVQRPDFLARYPVGMSAADFVNTLNATGGFPLTEAERDALVSQLSANNTTLGRATALRAVAENALLKQRETNRAFVLMQYHGYLRRDPEDPPEKNLNFEGYNFWLGKLNEHNGNFVEAEMVKAFIISTEYRQRFGQP
ncbi:MAG TPA: DUF4214 domain-containing protein [Pyrinomonadaceae bacterium]